MSSAPQDMFAAMAAMELPDLINSYHPNDACKDPRVRDITRAWCKDTAPMLVFYGPSGVGKTRLIGTLTAHPDYRPLVYVGIERGDSTIAEVIHNEKLVDRRVYAGLAAERLTWTYSTLDQIKLADGAAIAVEGVSALHQSITGRKLKGAPKVEGRALQQLNIEASQRSASVVTAIEEVKLDRIAYDRACPLFVTLNTKSVGLDDDKHDEPDWSGNLSERLMRLADAYIELERTPSGVVMRTEKDPQNKHRKLRNPEVSNRLQRYTDVTLPGLLALWAVVEHLNISRIRTLTA